MGKVAQALHCDASNATGIIDRLTALSLVMRQDNPADRRVKSLVLTDQGQDTLEKILKEMPKAMGCDTLSRQERCTMHDLVSKLSEPSNAS
jgi:DNA-binding MarR family transcriptional regulator